MNESDRRQRVISSTPRLSTEEIANHAFAKGVRGFSETEVRAFLRRVSEELAMARGREHEVETAGPAALGGETPGVLLSAREASDESRKKAEARAALLVEDASGAAERTRAEAAE